MALPAPPSPLPDAADACFSSRYRAELASRPARLVAALMATALVPALVPDGATARATANADRPPYVGEQAPAAVTGGAGAPVMPAPGDVEGWWAGAGFAAATCPGLPARVLVAIGEVETRLGTSIAPSAAGALGPMQFMPRTWEAYGVDGDGDGRADVMNTLDALHGAARLLCANGGADPGRLRSALWNYNHSLHYVDQVSQLAGLATG